MENITINEILYALIIVVLPKVLHYAYQLVSAKLSGTKHADAVNAVWTAVLYVNQTFVDSLKASGKFDEEAAKTAFELAVDAALEIMKDSTYEWIEKTYGNVDRWLKIQIESAVISAKEAA